MPATRRLPDRLRGRTRDLRSREDSEGTAGTQHPRHGRFDGDPSITVAAAYPCRRRARERLGKSGGEVVQSTARFWLSNARPAGCQYFCAYGDASPLRLHRAQARPDVTVVDQTVSSPRNSSPTTLRVHPLTDAHIAGVIHSLRETQATKALRRLLIWL